MITTYSSHIQSAVFKMFAVSVSKINTSDNQSPEVEGRQLLDFSVC